MPVNQDIAAKLDEVARILNEQRANPFRVQAYQHAAATLRTLPHPVSEIFTQEGMAGLEKLPGIGKGMARAIRDILLHGRLGILERLRGEHDPEALFRSVPGIGRSLARKLHEDFGLETLEDLEAAAHDGRLETLAGFGCKRLSGIRDSLAHRLTPVRIAPAASAQEKAPSVSELLDVDAEYRRQAAVGALKKIAPRRFNPRGEAWLPVLHTTRGDRHYTALYSNTARAHELKKTQDWVVLYYDGTDRERQCTIITSQFGRLKGLRIVRGQEGECEAHYRDHGLLPLNRLRCTEGLFVK